MYVYGHMCLVKHIMGNNLLFPVLTLQCHVYCEYFGQNGNMD